MDIDLFNTWFIIGCCGLAYFVLVILLLAISIRARLKYRKKILQDLERRSSSVPNPPTTLRWLAAVYLLSSLIVLGGLMSIIAIAVAYYLDFPLISNIDNQTLAIVAITAILIATVMSIILAVLSKKIYKIKD